MKYNTQFMYKGIEIHLSDAAAESIHPDDRTNLLDAFFKDEPINSIKWNTIDDIENEPEEGICVYTITNDTVEVVLQPLLRESDLLLVVDLSKEVDGLV